MCLPGDATVPFSSSYSNLYVLLQSESEVISLFKFFMKLKYLLPHCSFQVTRGLIARPNANRPLHLGESNCTSSFGHMKWPPGNFNRDLTFLQNFCAVKFGKANKVLTPSRLRASPAICPFTGYTLILV